jgi:scyllo-inositol 2-dehydrogenase (NADP+)
MIKTVVVGHGLAGRHFHCPLIVRQPELRLQGIVARDSSNRTLATNLWGARGYASLDSALADPATDLFVIATPHDTHAELAVRCLQAGRHCVVDKVMALNAAEAERMIAARDASGRMLSVFHNRRWDWDFLTVKSVLASGRLGKPLLFESSVCRYAPPRNWRGSLASAGTILHDWGAHFVDHALNLGLGPCRRVSAWLLQAPWPGVNSGSHGRIMMEFEGPMFHAETSRLFRSERPRWTIVGTDATLVKYGVDPQEQALRSGNIDAATEPEEHRALLFDGTSPEPEGTRLETIRGHWDSYYSNIADHLLGRAPLTVSAEDGREVVRVLDAANQSIQAHRTIEGTWGC